MIKATRTTNNIKNTEDTTVLAELRKLPPSCTPTAQKDIIL